MAGVLRVFSQRGSAVALSLIWVLITLDQTRQIVSSIGHPLSIVVVFPAAGVVTMIFMGIVYLLVHLITVVFTRWHGVLGEHQLELTPEGLSEETPYNKSLHRYVGVKGMRKCMGQWIVDLGAAGTFTFRDSGILEGDAEEFRKELLDRLVAAKQTTNVEPPPLPRAQDPGRQIEL